MATLNEYKNAPGVTSLGRGQVTRQLGGTAPIATTAKPKDLGPAGQFIDKAAAVGNQTKNLGIQAGKATGSFVVNRLKDTYNAADLTARTAQDAIKQPILNIAISQRTKDLDAIEQRIIEEYRAGRMSKENYTKGLLGLSQANQNLSKESQKISSGPSPQERAAAVAETAINVVTLGRGTTIAQAGKQTGVKFIDDAALQLEKAFTKVPAVKALFNRNAQYLTGRAAQKLAGETTSQFVKREGKEIAANILIKQPLFYQQNVGDAKKIYNDILDGDYKGALTTSAWVGSQMLNGGPLGAFAKVYGAGKKKLGQLAYGTGSFIDELSARIGDGNKSQIARFIEQTKTKAPETFRDIEKTFRVMQEGNLVSADNDVRRAVDNLVGHYTTNNIPLETLTPSQIYKDMTNWVKADELWNDLAVKKGLINGITKADAAKYTPVRWDAATRNGVASAFANVGETGQERLALLNELANNPQSGWANNPTLIRQLENILNTEPTGEDVARAIQNIDSAVLNADLPKRIAKQFSDLGYTIAMPEGGRVKQFVDFDDTRKLISGTIKDPELFDEALESEPILAGLAGFAEKAGLSPRSANRTANEALSQSVVSTLGETGAAQKMGINMGKDGEPVQAGQVILSTLKKYVDEKQPNKVLAAVTGTFTSPRPAITDIRQLTPGEIKEALKLSTRAEAAEVSRAIMKGYLDTPLEFRGLGDKVVDALYAANPLQKYYSRIQSALKYSYNPFFRAQERTETKLLSKVSQNNLLWNKSRVELDEGTRLLDQSGLFDSSMAGEAAQDRVLGRLTANITPGQKRDLAGLAYDIAEKKGTTLDQMLKDNPDEIMDALRVIVQYPTKGVLNSPLARTMNLAFFPMRYNLKVTQIAAKQLAKQPPSVQKAVLHSMFKMGDWLKSDEGVRWQSENADAIQLLKWVTPVNSIEYTMNLLGWEGPLGGSTGSDRKSIASLGLLGGLPLGVISQILDSQGVITLNNPYVDPKTGDVFPENTPVTTKARAAVALTDLMGTMFNYPGRVLGLPGKREQLKKLVANFIDTNGTDFDKQLKTEDLTPLQQNYIRVLKGDLSDEAIDALYNAPAEGQFNWYTMPPSSIPMTVRTPLQSSTGVERRTNLPTKTKAGKGKKAKPVALPMPS